VKFWTGHIRPGTAPVLVREGFSWGALLFGPLWLAAHRAWIAAALVLAASILITTLVPPGASTVLIVALAVWLGMSGHDLRRWSMAHRGFTLFGVVAARTEDAAVARLLDSRPDLAGRFGPAGMA
jgi:hypothetical protein